MKVPPSPKPQREFTVGGFRPTGKLRICPVLFGLLSRVEQLIEYTDGRKRWEKLWYPIEVGREE